MARRAKIAKAMSVRKRVFVVLFVLVVMPIAGVFFWGFLYQPLKYWYLISRVESARTRGEEKAAFRIAADWGRIWEVNRLTADDAVARERKLAGDWVLELEWLDSSLFTGRPYRAYRAVTDTNNLRILWEKKY